MHLLTATVVSKLMLMATVILGARWLGPAHWGQFAYAFTILYLIQLLSDFGFHTLLMREAAANRLSALLAERVVRLRALLGVAGIGLALAGVWLAGQGHLLALVAILGVSVFFRTRYATTRSILQGQQRMAWTIGLDGALYGGFLAVTLLGFVFDYKDPVTLSVAWLFGSMASMGVATYARHRLPARNGGESSEPYLHLFRLAAPFVMVNVLVVLFHRVGVLLLQSMRGEVEVGYYTAAYQIFDALALIPGLLVTVLFPRMVQAIENTKSSAQRLALLVALVTALPAILVLVFSDSLVALVYGPEYGPTSSVLPILMLGLPFMAATSVLAHYLFVIKLERISATSTAISLLINIVSNYAFIPVYGITAIAWISALSLMINFSAHVIVINATK